MSTASVDYARRQYYWRAHHERYARLVEAIGLICQECGGMGGEVVPVLDYGQGPWEPCGFCEGTGKITSWWRGWWLRWKREAKGL